MQPFKFSVLLNYLTAFTAVLAFSCTGKPEKKSESPVFKKIPSSQSGITFNNTVDENWDKNYFDNFAYVYNGGGVAIGDINNDGLQDIYFTGNEVPNKLYLNYFMPIQKRRYYFLNNP